MRSTLVNTLIVALCITLVCVTSASAYIDPGVASLALQAIVGALAAGLLTIKLWWHRVKSFFFGNKAKPSGEQSTRIEPGSDGAS
jgi:hypothetical protein